MRRCVWLMALAALAAAQTPVPQNPAPESQPVHQDQPTPDSQAAETSPAAVEAQPKRIELNLLGKTNRAAGESRRNENIHFNLVDNNALKELNVRLGTTATILEFRPERGYFGAEYGNAPSPVLHVSPLASVLNGWHGNL